MPPRSGLRLAVADEAFLHNAQLVIIRPIPTAFIVSCGKNFELKAVEKVGYKVGLTIGSIPKSDGWPRRLTIQNPAGRQLRPKLFINMVRLRALCFYLPWNYAEQDFSSTLRLPVLEGGVLSY